MEVVAIILLIIGALAIGSNTNEDSAPSEIRDSDELVIVTQAKRKDEIFPVQPRCHRTAGSIQQRDLTIPYVRNGKATFADSEKKTGAPHEE